MNIKTISAVLAFSFTASTVYAGPAASIADLGWMTGTWQAQLGPNTLQENWISPEGGSIAAMVRMSGNDATSMFEVITIEEKDGSLEMTVQQWNSGFVPRTPEAQRLALSEISENRINFTAVTEGSMTSLGYSLSADNVFTIEMGVPAGNIVKLDLKAKE